MPIAEFHHVPAAFRQAHYDVLARWIKQPEWDDLEIGGITLWKSPFRGTVLVQPRDKESHVLMDEWVAERCLRLEDVA